MTSAYLNRPEIPLAAALSRMLEHIEAELADNKLDASQEECLRRRAELIRRLQAAHSAADPAASRARVKENFWAM